MELRKGTASEDKKPGRRASSGKPLGEGIMGASTYRGEMLIGDQKTVGGYTITYRGLSNFGKDTGRIRVECDGKLMGEMLLSSRSLAPLVIEEHGTVIVCDASKVGRDRAEAEITLTRLRDSGKVVLRALTPNEVEGMNLEYAPTEAGFVPGIIRAVNDEGDETGLSFNAVQGDRYTVVEGRMVMLIVIGRVAKESAEIHVLKNEPCGKC